MIPNQIWFKTSGIFIMAIIIWYNPNKELSYLLFAMYMIAYIKVLISFYDF